MNINTLYSRFHRHFIGAWFALWLPLVMISFVPVFSSYLINVSITSVQDLILPLFLNLLIATGIALVCFRYFLKHRFRLYVVAITLTFVATNDLQDKLGGVISTLNSLLPISIPKDILAIGYVCYIVYVIYIIARFLDRQITKRHWPVREVMNGIALFVAVFFLAEAIPAARNIAQAWPQFFYQPPALAAVHPTAAEAAAKPDIYYILLEDYANQDVLKSQMNFDNSDFLNYLSGKGFYNVPGADSNYPYTVNSVASTFSANYLSDPINTFSTSKNQTLIPYFQSVKNSPVISQLKSLGYTYHLLGDWYETSDSSPLADYNYTNNDQIVFFNHTYSLDTFTNSEVRQNILYHIIKTGITIRHYRLLGYNYEDDITSAESQLAELQTLAAQPAGGRFIFSQILAPHNTFYFNADGSLNLNPNEDNNGKPVDKKYTNEIQFINSQIKPIIAEIMKNSGGKADIILQSDEGAPVPVINSSNGSAPDLSQDTGNMAQWPLADLKIKFGTLASYYIPGASQKALAQGANAVNIFRLLFNTDFNSSMSYLPQCYYGFPQGENASFVYQDINKLLTGKANQKCPDNSNFLDPGATKIVNGITTSPNENSGSSLSSDND